MKKFIVRAFLPFLLCIYIFVNPLAPTLARAASAMPESGSYACVVSDSAYFYSSPNEKLGVFLLPQTYYVRLISYGGEYCKIEYLYDDEHTQKLVGYAKTAQLAFVDYQPARPYLYYLFDVKYRIEDSDATDSSFLTEITVTCAYYGDYLIGSERWCYVLRNGEFGYIPKPATLSYEENTEYADYLASQKDSSEPESSAEPIKKKNYNGVQIAILIAICLLIPVLAALILKPPHRPPYETED